MSHKPTAVRVYLTRVRTSLADLPPSEVDEIVEDLRPHLAELESELAAQPEIDVRIEALVERLGTPESYAAEIRASGGYPPASETVGATATKAAPSGLLPPRIALWGLVFCAVGAGVVAFAAGNTLDADRLLGLVWLAPVFMVSLALLLRDGMEPVLALPEVRLLGAALTHARGRDDTGKTMRFLATLKPAWWIACALALVAFGLLLMARHRQNVLLLPFLIAAGVAAVWAGQRVRSDRRLLWMAAPVSAFVVGSVIGGFGATVDLIGNSVSYQAATSYYSTSDQYGNQLLSYGSKPVDNLYAFDSEGKPITDIYLYDEEGRPITVTRYGCQTSTGGKEKIGEDNRFPRPRIDRTEQPVTDGQGNNAGYRTGCRETTGVPFSAAIPKTTLPSSTQAPASTPVPSSPMVPSSAPSVPSSSPATTTPTK